MNLNRRIRFQLILAGFLVDLSSFVDDINGLIESKAVWIFLIIFGEDLWKIGQRQGFIDKFS